jgi:hypothetical protein
VLGGLVAAPALAASPQLAVTCATADSCRATGTGFTPTGQVRVQSYAGTTLLSSTSVTASAQTLVCATGGVKPVCHYVGGGRFGMALPVDSGLACDATAAGTVTATDLSTGLATSKPITWVGPCISTTTTLSLPSQVATGWTAATNPAVVTAGSTTVTSGTVTITVNGGSPCTYTAGATSGCTLANMPVGTDEVKASYSGTAEYAPSSASESVVVYKIQAPQVTTLAPTGVTAGEATLTGTVNPEGAPTTYYFEYGTTTAYGSTVPVPRESAGSGIAPESVSCDREPIYPNDVYHVRLVATNEDGTTYGADVEFKTPPEAPSLATGDATNVGDTDATLNGSLFALVGSGTVEWHFDYGPTTAYGSQTPDQSDGSGDATDPIRSTIGGLQPGTTYHYRLEATNPVGTTYGADAQFTTAGSSSSGPYGVSSVPMYNCLADGDGVYYWALDETAGGAWQPVGSQANLYDDTGTCPGAGSAPVTFTPSDHHVYDLVGVDPGMDGCSGDDPTDYDCIAASVQVEGDSTGPRSGPFTVT